MESMDPQAANAFKLSLEVDKIVIAFGNSEEEAPGPARVAVSDGVTMPVEIGRRFLYWLNQGVERHAALLRAQAAKALPPEQAATAMRPGQGPIRPATDEA